MHSEIGPILLKQSRTSWTPPKRTLPVGSTKFFTGESLRRYQLLRRPHDAKGPMAPGLNQGPQAGNDLLPLLADHQRNNLPASVAGLFFGGLNISGARPPE